MYFSGHQYKYMHMTQLQSPKLQRLENWSRPFVLQIPASHIKQFFHHDFPPTDCTLMNPTKEKWNVKMKMDKNRHVYIYGNWYTFVRYHGIKEHDLLIFRPNMNYHRLAFNVFIFRPNCCEISYPQMMKRRETTQNNRFFKVLDSGFRQNLKIPPIYATWYFKNQLHSNTCIFTNPNGDEWEIGMKMDNQQHICLAKNWKKFVQDNKLQENYVLLFTPKEVNTQAYAFDFIVFDYTACEIDYPVQAQKPPAALPHSSSCSHSIFDELLFTAQLGANTTLQYIPSSVKIPWTNVARKEIELRLQNTSQYNAWTVRYINQTRVFSRGWSTFVKDNNLNTGDVIIFYRTHEINDVLRVELYRDQPDATETAGPSQNN